MEHRKTTYTPSDASDVASLRQEIAMLSDTMGGGFSAYAEKFTNLHCSLIMADEEPDPKTGTAWVLEGIKNTIVLSHIISSLFAGREPDEEPTFKEIFEFVETFLKRMCT